MLTMSTLMMPASAVPASMSAPGLLPVPKLEAIRINHTPPNTAATLTATTQSSAKSGTDTTFISDQIKLRCSAARQLSLDRCSAQRYSKPS